jgi:hypothetical protein
VGDGRGLRPTWWGEAPELQKDVSKGPDESRPMIRYAKAPAEPLRVTGSSCNYYRVRDFKT